MSKKLVYGVGISENGKYARSVRRDGKNVKTPEYELWKNMLARCYSPAMNKLRPRYVGCTVSENFKNFQWFAEWCQQQVGFGLPRYQLEKDILVKSNKIYSEDTCLFVPNDLNMLLAKSNASRGDYPIGVHANITKAGNHTGYVAQCGNKHASKDHTGKGYIGLFDTVEEAFYAYKRVKERMIKDFAYKHKDNIDERMFEALLQYEVEITD